MTHTAVQQLLDAIELREQQLATQVAELAARLRELEGEREALAIAGKTIRAMAAEPARPPAPVLPDGAAYQQIMDVFDHEHRPLRARDLCTSLDLPILPKHTEGTRAKLKRLVSLGFLDETEPGLFARPHPQTHPHPADQRS